MKKVLVTILSLLYLSSLIGVTLNIHYCMDEMVGWGLGHHETKICGKCGMAESPDTGCCKDKYAVFKISVDQNKSSCSSLVPVIFKDVYSIPVIFNSNVDSSPIDAHSYTYLDPPPLLSNRRLHLLYCVFLI